jgi:FkbH-like protein
MTSLNTELLAQRQTREKKIKCVVWDLDNTLWDGVLSEGDEISLRSNITNLVKTLDSRGILQSVASKNDAEKALEMLRQIGLDEYFLYPQINWNSKVSSIENIAKSINIGLDTIAFIDDQPYERAEINYALPDVLCLDAAELDNLLEMPELNPSFITEDAAMRRQMYLNDARRKQAEETFSGPQEEFLATLGMVFKISAAKEQDLQRVEELTVRTNQLNTTGYTYSYDDLDYFRRSAQHKLLVAGLDDKFGSYGKIGLGLIECQPDIWTIKLLLMSCRVMTRGVGSLLISYMLQLAREQQVRLRAEFIQTGRNRMMYMTYKFAGFRETETNGDFILFENDLARVHSFPDYVRVIIED